jgi:RNA polymerase sigma-70 factor (ECF subfamily)
MTNGGLRAGGTGLQEVERAQFERVMLPHLDAAYNVARWLVRDEHEAQDLVQEAYLRAWKFFSGFKGGDSRVWLLAIVRNTSFSWLRKNRAHGQTLALDEEAYPIAATAPDPQEALVMAEESDLLHRALGELPLEYREVLILRELEELSYREIAKVADIAVGTVMSRLARGRQRLQQALAGIASKEKQQ